MNTKSKDVKEVSLTRDEIRDRILGHAPKPQTMMVTLFDTELELRQPKLDAILDMQETEDNKERMISMIIEYVFVPGPDDAVFEAADRDMILNWPFSEDVLKLQEAIADLTGIDIDGAEKDLGTAPLKE